MVHIRARSIMNDARLGTLGVGLAALLGGAFLGWRACRRQQKRRQRVAFVMQLNGPEHVDEYRRRHNGSDPYWVGPKAHLHRVMKANGVHNYSIHYLASTNRASPPHAPSAPHVHAPMHAPDAVPARTELFAYAEVDPHRGAARRRMSQHRRGATCTW